MALNLDTTFKLKAKVEGAKSVDNFKKQLRGLDSSSKLSKVQLGKMNIEINRMARAAGNTTKGLREHIRALTLLRDRTDIGGKAYKRLGNQIDRLKGKLKGLDGQAASTGQKLAGLVATLGVGRGIRRIIGGAATYEAEVTKAAAIEGGGNKNQLAEAVNATAQVAAGTPTQVAELATTLARAGFDADEIVASLTDIVAAAEASDVSFEEMGSIASNNLRAMGLEASRTGDVLDILVATANSSNQNIIDLGESLKYTAPMARAFGVNMNEAAAMTALLANSGIKGSDAGTALRSVFDRLTRAATGAKGELLGLTKGNQKLSKAFKALGADILDAEGNLKPMDEVIVSLRNGFQSIDNLGQKAEIAKALFGQQQGSKILALINQTDIDVAKLFETIINIGGVTATTRKNMDSFALTTKVLQGNFEVLTNQIGGAVISVLDPLAKLLNQFLTDISKLPKPIKDFGAGLAAAGIAALALKITLTTLTALGVKALIFGKVAKLLAALAIKTKLAALAMTIFNATNPVGWVAIGVTAITALSVVFAKFHKQIMEFLKSVRDGIYRYLILSFNALPKFIRELLIGKNNRPAGDDFTINLPEIKPPKDPNNIVEGDSNLEGGGINDETGKKQKQVLEGMKSALEDYRKKAEDVAGQVKSAMGKALQGMEDALVNFVMTGKLAFKDLARSIIADITRIVIRSAIISPILGGFGIKVGSAKGNVFAGGEHLTEYAYGGIVNRPTLFPMKDGMGLMGEAGAEAIMPLKRGSDGRLGVQSSGGVGNIVVNVDASNSSVEGDSARSEQLGKVLATAIQNEIVQQQRPGGLLA